MAKLEIKEWETRFFNRKFGILSIDNSRLFVLGDDEIHYALESLLSFSDNNKFSLLELQCDISSIESIPIIEEKGFRLVDTQIMTDKIFS